jgi:hypothetical protein
MGAIRKTIIPKTTSETRKTQIALMIFRFIF